MKRLSLPLWRFRRGGSRGQDEGINSSPIGVSSLSVPGRLTFHIFGTFMCQIASKTYCQVWKVFSFQGRGKSHPGTWTQLLDSHLLLLISHKQRMKQASDTKQRTDECQHCSLGDNLECDDQRSDTETHHCHAHEHQPQHVPAHKRPAETLQKSDIGLLYTVSLKKGFLPKVKNKNIST